MCYTLLYTLKYVWLCGVWKTNDIIPCRLGVKDYGLAVHCGDRICMLRRHVKTTKDSLPSYMDFITKI